MNTSKQFSARIVDFPIVFQTGCNSSGLELMWHFDSICWRVDLITVRFCLRFLSEKSFIPWLEKISFISFPELVAMLHAREPMVGVRITNSVLCLWTQSLVLTLRLCP